MGKLVLELAICLGNGESKKRRREAESFELLVGCREFVKEKQLVFFVKVIGCGRKIVS